MEASQHNGVQLCEESAMAVVSSAVRDLRPPRVPLAFSGGRRGECHAAKKAANGKPEGCSVVA